VHPNFTQDYALLHEKDFLLMFLMKKIGVILAGLKEAFCLVLKNL